MSDSAYRNDEGDVLASVRRLVMQGSAVPGAGEPDHVDRTAPGPEKLLLTPALRVGVEEGAPAGPVTGKPLSGLRTAAPEAPPPAEGAEAEGAWSLERRIAELEAVIGARPDEWEPDGSEDADQETPRRVVFQHRPLDLAGFEVDPPEPALPANRAASAEEPGIDLEGVDEETLRDLVAEIVRQELQGELGQRITRNIRKLVRREIHRALLSRELD